LKKVIISVSNDVITDQRVLKISHTLKKNGFEILIIGRKLPQTLNPKFPFKTHRFNLLFNKGFLFYTELNIRLFFKLLFLKKDLLYANDLDTLLPNFLIHKLFNTKLIYDSHELFTEVPELVEKPFVQKFWLYLESFILPKITNCITVSSSIANYYKLKYNTDFKVVKNVPMLTSTTIKGSFDFNTSTKKIILYQGALNKARGLELMIDAMNHLKDYLLIIIGDGDIKNELKNKATSLNLIENVKFVPKKSPDELKKLTSLGHIGISLEEDLGLNYKYALPNKLFDYIHARIPVLVSNLPEMKQIVKTYKIGYILEKRNPIYLAEKIRTILESPNSISVSNFDKAVKDLNWEKESQKLENLIQQ
jgi:glycosyltransferase involved in cell wall biosynthesis